MIVNNHFETALFCCCDEGKNVFGENPVLQTEREADRIAEKPARQTSTASEGASGSASDQGHPQGIQNGKFNAEGARRRQPEPARK